MSAFKIEGGNRLKGSLRVHGAKNSALPILAASLLCETPCEISNCPDLSDTKLAIQILKHLGCEISYRNETATVDARYACGNEIPDCLMRKMRSSVIFLGAVLSRCGSATISYPGGCELGPRPIDMHLKALRQLGAKTREEYGRVVCNSDEKLCGTQINLPFPSVGATENILIAAACAKGQTKIHNAAREPEIVDLANFLNCCGADVSGAGESTIIIRGVKSLHGCKYRIIPDRIAATTYMAAAAITGGELELYDVVPEHIEPAFSAFCESGCDVDVSENSVRITAPDRLSRIKQIKTLVYPGFPTDAQAPMMALAAVADGTSVFIETIFESRFKHVDELRRMGADIKIDQRVAVVEGVKQLFGSHVSATDLRGGAALVVAALAAKGATVVHQISHIDRGYADLEYNLQSVGASITRI